MANLTAHVHVMAKEVNNSCKFDYAMDVLMPEVLKLVNVYGSASFNFLQIMVRVMESIESITTEEALRKFQKYY